jgi:signal recognition particle GTPase
LAVAQELGIPITHMGVGERMRDLKSFDAREFVDSILR